MRRPTLDLLKSLLLCVFASMTATAAVGAASQEQQQAYWQQVRAAMQTIDDDQQARRTGFIRQEPHYLSRRLRGTAATRYEIRKKNGRVTAIARYFSLGEYEIRQSFYLQAGSLFAVDAAMSYCAKKASRGSDCEDALFDQGTYTFRNGRLESEVTLGHMFFGEEEWPRQATLQRWYLQALRATQKHQVGRTHKLEPLR